MKYQGIELPDGLSSATVGYIKSIIKRFANEDRLDKLDSFALLMLASKMEDYLECDRMKRERGLTEISDRGNISISPFVLIQDKAFAQVHALLRDFFLTPGSRQKRKETETAETTPLQQIINDSDDDEEDED